jgi:predicted RNA-binding Zn ribbon-like protein
LVEAEWGKQEAIMSASGTGAAGLWRLYGGRLCLDFANTVEPREAEPHRDTLGGYADLVRWARDLGTLDDATAAGLLRTAAGRQDAAATSFATAIVLREATYRAFAAIAHGAPPAGADLETVQQAYAEAMRHAHLQAGSDQLAWAWEDDELDRAWWPVARSAVELATAGQLDRVKQCASSGGCGWLFYDTSKNRIRRWCSMGECGAQTKAKRQTARRRASRTQTG